MKYTVYILHFFDRTHYCGITTRTLQERIYEHMHNPKSTVSHKATRHISFVTGATYKTDNPKDELFYKRNVKRYCKICTPGVSNV